MTSNVSSTSDTAKKMTCEQCKKKNKLCDTQDCAYSVFHDGSRSIFSTQTAKRLGSGSACATCRKRKTKCDGSNPCGFCASNRIECFNRPERRQSKKQVPPAETMERIDDRLRRIERLMGAFAPSTLAQPSENHKLRPQRHTVQGVNSSREMKELNERGSRITSISPPPPPSTPISINNSQCISHSMLDLSISPSNSSRNQILFASSSTPSLFSPNNDYFKDRLPSPPSRIENDWHSTASIPSLMDQLSKRTFATIHETTQYPIYPLTPPASQQKNES